MGINVENFSVSINYDKMSDKLDLESDRNLNNGDILLLLVNILSMIEASYRPTILEIAQHVLEDQKVNKLN